MDRKSREILQGLYEAGGRRVPAEALSWGPEQVPSILFLLTMGYMVKREERDGVSFSLSKAGYDAIGQARPSLAPWDVLVSLFERWR